MWTSFIFFLYGMNFIFVKFVEKDVYSSPSIVYYVIIFFDQLGYRNFLYRLIIFKNHIFLTISSKNLNGNSTQQYCFVEKSLTCNMISLLFFKEMPEINFRFGRYFSVKASNQKVICIRFFWGLGPTNLHNFDEGQQWMTYLWMFFFQKIGGSAISRRFLEIHPP